METSKGVWGPLIRHFWGRFFDKESISPQGEPEANVTQTLGILAVPSAFFVLVMRPLTLVGWELVAVRYIFVAFSMIVMAFLMVVEWDALFPDARDYQILNPLPLRISTVFLAKAIALAWFLGVFLLDINFFGMFFWTGIDARPGVLNTYLAHITAVVSGGLFAALAVAALHGALITLLPARVFRRVSVALQTVLVTVLVMLLVLTPLLAFRTRMLVNSGSPLLQWLPPFWFVGLYERLRPAVGGGDPALLRLGAIAVRGLEIAAAVFALTYIPFYRHHARKFLETPAPNPTGPGRLRRLLADVCNRGLLRHPVERAVFHFMTQTITRSVKHRLFLATYGGFGIALAVMSLGAGRSGLLRLPLTLSFILVSGLRAAFNFPSELRANWAFQISESEQAGNYVAAMRKWIVVGAILPLFALLAPMELALFPWTAALFHLAFGITLSVLLMDILFFGFQKIPFTCAYFPGKVNLVGLSLIYILGFTMYSSAMSSVEVFLYDAPAAALAFFAVGWGVHGLLAYGHKLRLGSVSAIDYEDPGDPVVRTLELS